MSSDYVRAIEAGREPLLPDWFFPVESISPQAASLIVLLLHTDPAQRLTAAEAKKHPWCLELSEGNFSHVQFCSSRGVAGAGNKSTAASIGMTVANANNAAPSGGCGTSDSSSNVSSSSHVSQSTIVPSLIVPVVSSGNVSSSTSPSSNSSSSSANASPSRLLAAAPHVKSPGPAKHPHVSATTTSTIATPRVHASGGGNVPLKESQGSAPSRLEMHQSKGTTATPRSSSGPVTSKSSAVPKIALTRQDSRDLSIEEQQREKEREAMREMPLGHVVSIVSVSPRSQEEDDDRDRVTNKRV